MIRLSRLCAALVMCAALAACNTPRGAGFQDEVLKAAAAPGDAVSAGAFAVYPVTRATVEGFAGWPAVGSGNPGWITRREQPASLIIAPGDRISVSIWDTEENSLLAGPGERGARLEQVLVSPSGMIFLPFVGEMKVSGMSQQTARAKIEERFAASIPSAQVQITVEPGRANTADLVSGVQKPGVYPLVDRNVTVLSLIAQGGGVHPQLDNPQVRLIRGGKSYAVSVARLFSEPALDTTLQGGDRVIVEEDRRNFLSLGAAGSESLHPFPRDQVSALEALAIIGGVEENRANPKGVLILREYPGSAVGPSGPSQGRVVFTIDLTSADGLFSAGRFRIMPGDLVYATESPITSARTLTGLLGSMVGLADRLN